MKTTSPHLLFSIYGNLCCVRSYQLMVLGIYYQISGYKSNNSWNPMGFSFCTVTLKAPFKNYTHSFKKKLQTSLELMKNIKWGPIQGGCCDVPPRYPFRDRGHITLAIDHATGRQCSGIIPFMACLS